MGKIRAQGLAINTVILIAVGLLILILLVIFALGGFKGLGAAKPNSFAAFVQDCRSACQALNGATSIAAANAMAYSSGGFCSLSYNYNNSGTNANGGQAVGVAHCYDTYVYGTCYFTLSNGSEAYIGESTGCGEGAQVVSSSGTSG